MAVKIELPADIEENLRSASPNLEAELREAGAVELFRRGRLNHFQLSRALGLSRVETDALLKRHDIEEQSLTAADLASDRATLRTLLG